MRDVNKLSTRPTIAIDMEYGNIILKVSILNGTSGINNCGKLFLISPKSPTVLTSAPVTKYVIVSKTIAIKGDRKSTRLNSSHVSISYAVFCLQKKNATQLLPYNTASTTS